MNNDDPIDPLAPAEGILSGCALSALMWFFMGVIWMLLK